MSRVNRRRTTDSDMVAVRRRDTNAEAGPGGQLFSVGELARQAQVSPRTIRYYEEVGLLNSARRYAGGRRVFNGDALQRLRFIGRLKRLGLTLKEISHLNEVFAVQQSTGDMLSAFDGLLEQHLASISESVKELTALREEIGAYQGHVQERMKCLTPGRRSSG